MKWQKVVQIQPGTGLPHYHLMVSQYIPFKWVMKAWKAVGGGGVYIRYVKIDTVSGFIKGYFTRQILGIDFPSRKRRYSCSRNISLARPKQAGWEIRQWISAPAYSKKGYVTGVEREDFVLPPSAFLSGSEEPPGSGDLQLSSQRPLSVHHVAVDVVQESSPVACQEPHLHGHGGDVTGDLSMAMPLRGSLDLDLDRGG
jgi:hypothetical protein